MMAESCGRVLYVYYKVDQTQEVALLPLIKSFQQQLLARWPRLSCELMQRPPGVSEGQRTWMEIYHHADTLSDQMIDGIAQLARDMQLPAARFSEIFTPLR